MAYSSKLRSFTDPSEFKNFRRGFLLESKYGIEDPTFLSFHVEFKLDPMFQHHDHLYNSPLFTKPGSGYGAIEYLSLLGYKNESDRLLKFQDILRWVQNTTPWYFQSIDGLDEVWKMSTDMTKPMQNAVLTFNCLESVDLRMTYLADLYRKSIYDTVYMRELVPENLRFFEMSIQICEFRNIRSTLNKLENIKSSAQTEDEKLEQLQSIINELNYIEFVFSQCEFDFSESFPGSSNVSNNDPQMATNKFKVKVHKWYEKNYFPYFNDETVKGFASGPNTQSDYNIEKDIKEQNLKVKEAYTADNFGIFNNTIKNAKINLDNLNTRIQNAPSNLIANVSSNIQQNITNLGDVYPNTPVIKPTLTSKNVYDGINRFIPPNISENLGNVYE